MLNESEMMAGDDFQKALKESVQANDWGLAWVIGPFKYRLYKLPGQQAWKDLDFKFSGDPELTIGYKQHNRN